MDGCWEDDSVHFLGVFPFLHHSLQPSESESPTDAHMQKERNLVKASNEQRLELLVRLHSLNSVAIPGGIWDIGRERRGCLGEQSATKPPISYYTCGLSISSFKCPCNKLHSCDCSRGAGPVFRCSCAWQCPARARLSAGSIRAGFDRAARAASPALGSPITPPSIRWHAVLISKMTQLVDIDVFWQALPAGVKPFSLHNHPVRFEKRREVEMHLFVSLCLGAACPFHLPIPQGSLWTVVWMSEACVQKAV